MALRILGAPTGTSVPMYPTPPTGSGDDVALQAYINACQTAGITPRILQAGTYVLNNPVTVSGPIEFGDGTQTFRASSSFPAGQPLFQTPAATLLTNVTWQGGPVFDCNGIAIAFQLNYFNRLRWLGMPTVLNPNLIGAVIGSGGAQNGDGFKHTGGFVFDRSSGGTASGSVGILLNAPDSILEKVSGRGVETMIVDTAATNEIRSCHPTNPNVLQGYCIQAAFGSKLVACASDTFGTVAHGSATGSAASSAILDPGISPYHQGLRVTGVNIPAPAPSGSPCFIGAVVAGTSFTLVDAKNTPVNPIGAVAGVTLMPAGVNIQAGAYAQIIGGITLNNAGVSGVEDNVIDAVVVGHNARVRIEGYELYGTSGAFRIANAIIGDLTFVSWTGVSSNPNVVNTVAARSGPDGTTYNQTTGNASPAAAATTFGAAVTLNPDTPYRGLVPQGLVFQPAGVVAGEILTYKIVATMSGGGTNSFTLSGTAGSNSKTNSAINNMAVLLGDGNYVVSMAFSVESSIANSAATATCQAFGLNDG